MNIALVKYIQELQKENVEVLIAQRDAALNLFESEVKPFLENITLKYRDFQKKREAEVGNMTVL